jgi:hypothetical protein
MWIVFQTNWIHLALFCCAEQNIWSLFGSRRLWIVSALVHARHAVASRAAVPIANGPSVRADRRTGSSACS